MTLITATSAARFVASIGVNASINYTDGKYANIQTVLADLKYIGVSLIRTAAYVPGMQGQSAYNLAASQGIRFDMLLYANPAPQTSVAQMAAFASAHPGALVSIEGPNEINNFGVAYRGLTGAAAAVSFQNDLFADIRANGVLNGTTVYSYTMNAGASSTTGYDVATIHPYAVNGAAPLLYLHNNLAAVPAAKPFAVTEAGYSSLGSASGGVDAHVQAIYDLDTLFDAHAAGAQSAFLYELLDAYADPAGTLVGNHFGLFDIGNAPKPAAVALHNLTQILGGGPASYSAGGLSWSITGADKTAGAMLLQKATNLFDLVVWDEQPIWNSASHSEVAASTHTEALRFARIMQTVAVYDPLLGTTPIATYHDVSSIALPLGADPLVVELTPVPTWTPAMDGARAASKSIEATASGMLIVGAAGDTITATGNRDTFALHAGFGNETITGFVGGTAPADVIQFDKGLFDSFAAVQGAMHQVGDSVVITYDAHDQLVLNHVGMAQLSASNFLFV